MMNRTPFEARFWAQVEKTDTCWLWTGSSKGANGYGQIRVNHEKRLAHRVSYEMHVGHIPPGMLVDHKCHNRVCVNPAHLRLATHKQNAENLSGAYKNNVTTGIRGVYLHAGKRQGQVRHMGRKITVGTFPTKELAEQAVIAKRIELFTHNILDKEAA